MTDEERKHVKWADVALELAMNGLRNRRSLVLTDDPATSAVEMWNINAARISLRAATRTEPTSEASPK